MSTSYTTEPGIPYEEFIRNPNLEFKIPEKAMYVTPKVFDEYGIEYS